MKKAFAQLTAQGLAYEFHDYKKQGIDTDTLQQWLDQVGMAVLLNKKGTTWRKFSPEQQAKILSSASASLQAMLDNNTLIKRPVLVRGKQILVGFHPDEYQQLTG